VVTLVLKEFGFKGPTVRTGVDDYVATWSGSYVHSASTQLEDRRSRSATSARAWEKSRRPWVWWAVRKWRSENA